MQKGFQTEASKTNPNRIELYVPKEKKKVIEEAAKILERENSSLSKRFVEICEKLVQEHSEGNPQQKLDRVLTHGIYLAPETKWSLCKFSTNDFSSGINFPCPSCDLTRNRVFVGKRFERCSQCHRFQRRRESSVKVI